MAFLGSIFSSLIPLVGGIIQKYGYYQETKTSYQIHNDLNSIMRDGVISFKQSYNLLVKEDAQAAGEFSKIVQQVIVPELESIRNDLRTTTSFNLGLDDIVASVVKKAADLGVEILNKLLDRTKKYSNKVDPEFIREYVMTTCDNYTNVLNQVLIENKEHQLALNSSFNFLGKAMDILKKSIAVGSQIVPIIDIITKGKKDIQSSFSIGMSFFVKQKTRGTSIIFPTRADEIKVPLKPKSTYRCHTEHPADEFVLEISNNYIPLWNNDSRITWNFDDQFPEDKKQLIRTLMNEVKKEWNLNSYNMDLGEVTSNGTFSIVNAQSTSNVVAKAFFPDSEERQLLIFEIFFSTNDFEFQRGVLCHEFGHILGLRHEFAIEREGGAIRLGDPNPSSIMSYNKLPKLSELDRTLIAKIYSHSFTELENVEVNRFDPNIKTIRN